MATVSDLYGGALYSLSMESGLLNEYLEQAVFLRETLETHELIRIFEHPDISPAGKREFLHNAFAGKIHDDLLGFLYLMIAKNRESDIVSSLTRFIDLGDAYNGKATANVVTAVELSQKQILALEDVLSRKLNKAIKVATKVEKDVIGGLSVYVDGYYFDRTIKRQLYGMKETIKRSMSHDFRTR